MSVRDAHGFRRRRGPAAITGALGGAPDRRRRVGAVDVLGAEGASTSRHRRRTSHICAGQEGGHRRRRGRVTRSACDIRCNTQTTTGASAYQDRSYSSRSGRQSGALGLSGPSSVGAGTSGSSEPVSRRSSTRPSTPRRSRSALEFRWPLLVQQTRSTIGEMT